MFKSILGIVLSLAVLNGAQAFEFEQYCDVFPRPVQTYNDLNGTLWMNENAQVSGAKDHQLGFVGINIADGTQLSDTSCEYEGIEKKCVANSELIVVPQPLPEFQEGTEKLTILKSNIDEVAPGGILKPAKYKLLELNGVDITFQEGEYWIDTLQLNISYADDPNVPTPSTITIENGKSVIVHFKQLRIYGGSRFNNYGTPDDLLLLGHFLNKGEWDALHLTNNTVLNALLFSRGDIYLDGNNADGSQGTLITGAVTANKVFLRGYSKILGNSQCIDRQYKLTMTPVNGDANTCSRIPITFKVTNDKGEQQTDISGDLTVKATNHLDTACWATSESGNCIGPDKSVTLTAGSTELWLQNKAIGTVNAEATFTSNETGELKSEQGNYTFKAGGFRFSPSPLKMVAGKPEKLSIEAVYGDCDPTQIPDYEGTKTLKFGEASYLQPAYAGGAAPTKPTINDKSGEQTLNVNFVDGRANNAVTVRYADAGALSIPVEEVSAGKSGDGDETDISEAPEKRAETEKLTGDAILHVRPYTMAICNISRTQTPSSDNGRLSKAGESFSASLMPVIWKSGDRTDGGVVTLGETYCSRSITASFKRSDAPAAQVTFDSVARIVTPSLGSDAIFDGFAPKANTETVGNGLYQFPSIKVSDVGTFKLRSQLVSQYLDMTVNPGERAVGRFYPSHFSVSGNVVPENTPRKDSEGKGFTYLNQPFDGQYTVLVMTADNKPVKNYHLLDSAYKAELEDWVISPVSSNPVAGDDLSERWTRPDQTQWEAGGDGTSQLSLSSGRMMVQKGSSPEFYPNPLYFAVGVSNADVDGTDFRFCDEQNVAGCEAKVIKPATGDRSSLAGAEFGQGEFLFGRMRIEGFSDTKTPFSEQTLPVAVEVFNGTHFVTNTRDSATIVSTEIGKKDVLFSDKPNNVDSQAQIVLLDGDQKVIEIKTVKKGRADFHVIAPDQSSGLNREQFRYWQQLDKAVNGVVPQTWLQHNWQGTQFDDDPSGIGIFGFYRGSDRVIYKGEKNITLTEE